MKSIKTMGGLLALLLAFNTATFAQNIENSDRAPVREVDPTTPPKNTNGTSTTVIKTQDNNTNTPATNGSAQNGSNSNNGTYNTTGSDNTGNGNADNSTVTDNSGTTGTAMQGSSTTNNDCCNGLGKYSWAGLLGLLGLIGLIPRRNRPQA